MSNAEDAYKGRQGAAYWKRNGEKVQDQHRQRVQFLRFLVPTAHLWIHNNLLPTPWLEVGCGRGDNLLPGDVGLDCDARQLSYLFHKGVVPVLGSATSLPFPDAAFLTVMSVGCMMHLNGEDLEKALKELTRVAHKYVILGEYLAEQEEPVTGKHWDGLLWQRPYHPPKGWQFMKSVRAPVPFDPDVTFLVWERQ